MQAVGPLLGFAVLTLPFSRPAVGLEVYFEETFSDASYKERWMHSKWEGIDGKKADFEWSRGPWFGDPVESLGLRTVKDHSYNIISAKFPPFSNRGKTLVIQYSIRQFTIDWLFCGGGYIKLLPSDFDQENFGDPTEYLIMFGPNVCGYDHAHYHLTFWTPHGHVPFRDMAPINQTDHDEYTRWWTLILFPNDTYVLMQDWWPMSSGDMRISHGYHPPHIDDPKDKMPRKWDNRAKIPHPDHSKKAADWHDERMIPHPEQTIPKQWDEKEDGPWKPPMIENPNYRGVWKSKKIKNPAFKGVWEARKLPNPKYIDEVHAYDDIGGIGFELWTPKNGTIFDNVLVTDDIMYAKEAFDRWAPIRGAEKDMHQKAQDHQLLVQKKGQYELTELSEEEEEVEEEDGEEGADSEDDEDEEDEELGGSHRGLRMRSASTLPPGALHLGSELDSREKTAKALGLNVDTMGYTLPKEQEL